MNDTQDRPNENDRSNATATTAIPEAQARAVTRRHALDEQQRMYQGAYPPPHMFRRRPPG